MFRAAICDYIKVHRSTIRALITKYACDEDIELYEYENGQKMLDNLARCFNLVFLDIQMLGVDGKETAKYLFKALPDAVFAFLREKIFHLSRY